MASPLYKFHLAAKSPESYPAQNQQEKMADHCDNLPDKQSGYLYWPILFSQVFLSDKGEIKENYKKILEENAIEFEEKNHDEERILAADWIIKSPGIPKKAEMIQKIKAKGIRLSSEIEFGAEFTDAKIIAITGSNGKTTTTSLIYHILKNDNSKVVR